MPTKSGRAFVRWSWAALLGLLLGAWTLAGERPAFASAPAEHKEQDITGWVVACQNGTTYTVLSGSLRVVFHHETSASGNEHHSVTMTAEDVLVTDGATTFRFVGASHEGSVGKSDSVTPHYVITADFAILKPGEGIVDRVQLVAHGSPNGMGKTFTAGQCAAPSPPPD